MVKVGRGYEIILWRSTYVLEEIGVMYENGDAIYEAYGIGSTVPFYTKTMNHIVIGNFTIKNFEIDVGMLPNNHNALLGLDILKKHRFVIDLKKLELTPDIKSSSW